MIRQSIVSPSMKLTHVDRNVRYGLDVLRKVYTPRIARLRHQYVVTAISVLLTAGDSSCTICAPVVSTAITRAWGILMSGRDIMKNPSAIKLVYHEGQCQGTGRRSIRRETALSLQKVR